MSWPLVKLADIANVVTGATPKKRSEYYDGDVPFVTPGDLGETSGITSTSRTLTQEGADSVRSIPAGSVMVCCIGATIGKVGIAEKTVVTNQQINSLVVDERKAFPKYVYYYCATLKEKLKAASSSTTMPIVNKSNFSQFEIPLPPLEEQKRIAAILDKADAIRQKRKQAIDLADEFLRSVFLDMFGDPVTNPKGWEVKEIDQVCTEIVDCVNRTAPTVDYETPYKMIRTTNIRNHKIDLSSVRYVEKEVYEKWVRRLKPEVGDVIFTREAPAGEAGIINFKDSVFLGQRTMHFRPESEKITSTFLLYELMAPGVQQQIARLSAGSTVTHLSVPECKKFKIRTPSLENQQRFTDIVDKVERSKNSLLASLEQSIELFHSLSQKAFSGQL